MDATQIFFRNNLETRMFKIFTDSREFSMTGFPISVAGIQPKATVENSPVFDI